MQAHKRQQKVYMQALCDHGWAWPEWPQGGEISHVTSVVALQV